MTNKTDNASNNLPFEIDPIYLLSLFWKARIKLCAYTLVFTFLAAIISLLLPIKYSSSITIIPAESSSTGLSSGLAGQLSGLASMAGFNIGSISDDSPMAMATLTSREFIYHFLHISDAKKILFEDSWDKENNKWLEPPLVDRLKKSISTFLNPQGLENDVTERDPNEPSDLEAYNIFMEENFSVLEDIKTGIITVKVTTPYPNISAAWANEIVKTVNDHIRTKDRGEAKRSIEYLESQIMNTSVAEMQKILYQLIETQTKTIMLTKVREEYAYRIIDRAVPPEEKTSPNRKLITFIGFTFGLAMGIIAVLHQNYRRNEDAVLSLSRG